MSMGWQSKLKKRDKLYVARERRLHRLMQKRAVLDQQEVIKPIYSYNRKRGKVNALPHQHAQTH